MTAAPTAPMRLNFRRGVRESSAYPGDHSQLGRSTFIRLDRNEATRPVSPHVNDAITAYVANYGVHRYPDVGELTASIASYCGVDERCVMPTNGSDHAIDLCLRALLRPGDTVLVARPEFATFTHIAGLLEARIRGIPYGSDLAFPYDAFRAGLAQRPDLIVIVNPNNPTGTPVQPGFIEEVAARWPDVPVIVDEAYYEFTGVTVAPLISLYPNLIVLRTFSKAFAMAGLRLGYVLGEPAVVSELVKLRKPFDINSLAVLAAQVQLAHLSDVHAYVHRVTTVVKPMTVRFFQQHQIPVWPGAANFVLVRPDDSDRYVCALRDAGVLVRPMSAPLLAGTFRMSLGTDDEMTYVLSILEGVLSASEAKENRDE